ncbi:MAG TPA: carboxypeptidase regulatory-like domain-containing protein, partial [Longimicrobiales bacterium]|nr:carboxypeptidase regulatory-like domain-containing protein [Longimicrobiales bacterium]
MRARKFVRRIRPLVVLAAFGAAALPAGAQQASMAGGAVAPVSGGGGADASSERAEQGAILGQVVDAQTREPLAGVQVVVTGTSLGSLTDESGRFRIGSVPAGLYTVEATRIGYSTAVQENVDVPDDGTVTVNFEMRVTALTLDEIVATGVVDPTSARRVPFTVNRVSEEALEVPSENAVTSIQGKVAGVSVVTSPQPGAGFNMVLRSPTSINKTNSPLVVVDGVILASTFGRSSADIGSLDIESIEIVKGAAAASLYGSRAANGVIQIRTKRGTGLAEGQTQITVRSEWGQNMLAGEISRASSHHYLLNEAGQYVDADGNLVDREDRVERPASERFLDQPYPDATFDHVDQFFDPGTYSNNSLSIGQNTESTNWFASYSRRNVDGVVLGHEGYLMNDFRVNLDHRLRTDLTFSVSGYHMRSERDGIPSGTFMDLVQQAPDADLRQPDPDGTPYIWQPDPLGVTPNPLYALVLQ